MADDELKARSRERHVYPWVTAFVDKYLADAQRLASMIGHGATAYEVLAVGGVESHYDTAKVATVRGNYFGIHSRGIDPSDYFVGQIGAVATKKDSPLAVYDPRTGFYQSGLRLVAKLRERSAGQNLSNPATFFRIVHHSGWGTTTANYEMILESAYLLVLRAAPQGPK